MSSSINVREMTLGGFVGCELGQYIKNSIASRELTGPAADLVLLDEEFSATVAIAVEGCSTLTREASRRVVLGLPRRSALAAVGRVDLVDLVLTFGILASGE